MALSAGSRWSDLFDQAVSIIEQANSNLSTVMSWSFGGGTALMLQIGHRDSFDVDIFIDDPQVLPYLNPQIQGYALELIPSGYSFDGSASLKIAYADIGEIDFICAGSLTDHPAIRSTLSERDVLLETPAEIIAKKICYRGASLQPRDMFDIACVVRVSGLGYLVDALTPYRSECGKALDVARRMNPQFAEAIMTRLLYREGFADIPSKAQAATIEFLETVCFDRPGLG